jgi:hypothetical protein
VHQVDLPRAKMKLWCVRGGGTLGDGRGRWVGDEVRPNLGSTLAPSGHVGPI